jgi:hypothetical protein
MATLGPRGGGYCRFLGPSTPGKAASSQCPAVTVSPVTLLVGLSFSGECADSVTGVTMTVDTSGGH